MALTEAAIERVEGDLLSRRRKVDAMLNGPEPMYDGFPIRFGPLDVRKNVGPEGLLMARDPDGDLHEVDAHPELQDPERIEEVERELREAWEAWLDAL